MSTLILFTTKASDSLAEELSRQNHTVFEALAISEVFALAEQHPDSSIIIKSDIDAERAKAIQHHYPTMHLKANATVQDIVWELNLKGAIVQ